MFSNHIYIYTCIQYIHIRSMYMYVYIYVYIYIHIIHTPSNNQTWLVGPFPSHSSLIFGVEDTSKNEFGKTPPLLGHFLETIGES